MAQICVRDQSVLVFPPCLGDRRLLLQSAEPSGCIHHGFQQAVLNIELFALSCASEVSDHIPSIELQHLPYRIRHRFNTFKTVKESRWE